MFVRRKNSYFSAGSCTPLPARHTEKQSQLRGRLKADSDEQLNWLQKPSYHEYLQFITRLEKKNLKMEGLINNKINLFSVSLGTNYRKNLFTIDDNVTKDFEVEKPAENQISSSVYT